MQNRTTKDPNAQDSTTHAPMARRSEERESRDRDRDPDEIRRDIRETRGEMDRTVDELVDRFSVGSLVDEAWQRMRGTGGGASDVGGMLREHPVPFALVGLGLGWLAVEQASGHSMSTDNFGSGSRTHGNGGGPQQSEMNRSRDSGGNGVSDIDDRMGGNGTVDDDGITNRVSEQASEAMSSAREKASDMKESTKAAASRTRAGLQEFLAESPLTVGSIVFGLGLATGLAVPSSELEDREIGEVSDRIKSKAGQLGNEAAERAGEIGHEVVDTAMSETRDQVDDFRDDGPDDGQEDRPSRM